MIGFDTTSGLYYEGVSNYGYGLWPSPLVMRACFIHSEADWNLVSSQGSLRDATIIFREDYFDPVTRIRRGRFYEWAGGRAQPDQWWVQRHPVLTDEVGQRNHQGLFGKTLVTFTPMQGLPRESTPGQQTIVVLGAGLAVTVWTLISIERAGNDQDVVTLRARSNFGFLPDLVFESIPDRARARVSAAVSKVTDAAHRMPGIAVVDLCRDAATVVISEYLVDQGKPRDLLESDLGAVLKALPEHARLQRCAADLIRMLHPRGKANEQLRHDSRAVVESDGVLALESFGFLLRELGWAR